MRAMTYVEELPLYKERAKLSAYCGNTMPFVAVSNAYCKHTSSNACCDNIRMHTVKTMLFVAHGDRPSPRPDFLGHTAGWLRTDLLVSDRSMPPHPLKKKKAPWTEKIRFLSSTVFMNLG